VRILVPFLWEGCVLQRSSFERFPTLFLVYVHGVDLNWAVMASLVFFFFLFSFLQASGAEGEPRLLISLNPHVYIVHAYHLLSIMAGVKVVASIQ
jgi:hypothetical protein